MYKVSCIIAIILLNISFITVAQKKDEIAIEAFKASYASESLGKYEDAIKSLQNVYEADSYEFNARLGWLNYYSGLFSESTGYYSKAIKIMPMSIEAKLGLVLPLTALGFWDQVETQYKDILKIDPKNVTTLYKYGLLLYGRKDYKNADKYFTDLTNMYPFEYNYVLTLAWVKYFMNKHSEAKVLFRKTLLISPYDTSALEGLDLIK